MATFSDLPNIKVDVTVNLPKAEQIAEIVIQHRTRLVQGHFSGEMAERLAEQLHDYLLRSLAQSQDGEVYKPWQL